MIIVVIKQEKEIGKRRCLSKPAEKRYGSFYRFRVSFNIKNVFDFLDTIPVEELVFDNPLMTVDHAVPVAVIVFNSAINLDDCLQGFSGNRGI